MPLNTEKRNKWIAAIETHQKFDHTRRTYYVCIKHFIPEDYEVKRNKTTLNPDAIPSIFENRLAAVVKEVNNYQIIGDEIVVDATENRKCFQCPFLLEKVKELQRELLKEKTAHNISVQMYEHKIFSMQTGAADKSKNIIKTKQELANEKAKNSKLKDILEELKAEQFLTEDDEKFLNVNHFFLFECLNVPILMFMCFFGCFKPLLVIQ